MVAATAVSRKRKQTADMPASPPKRLTRARAKASEDNGADMKSKTITTASARIAAGSMTPIKPARVTKRRTRADDIKENTATDAVQGEEREVELLKIKRRPRKAPEASENEQEPDPTTTTRSRSEKVAEEADDSIGVTKKPRTRAKKAVGDVVGLEGREAEPAKRTVRVRSEAARTRATSAAVSRSTAVRKRVTFEDDTEDKENLPVPEAARKPKAKATGLNAKPVRKAAVAKVTARGKKASAAATAAALQPLSPKKITQLAKSNSSICSEDEQDQRTPPRALSKSPLKAPLSIRREVLPDTSEHGRAPEPGLAESPFVDSNLSTLASPARRPPPLFKDALKESPKRINIVPAMHPPDRHVPQSPQRAPLLHSPARRPMTPFKGGAFGSPSKSNTAVPAIDATTASRELSTFKLPAITPQRLYSSPLRAYRFHEHSVKVHKMGPAEMAAAREQTESPTTAKTPVFALSPVLDGPTSIEFASTQASPPRDHIEPTAVDYDDALTDNVPATASEETAAFFSSSVSSDVSYGSGSEDGLESSRDINTTSSLRAYNISTKDFGMKAASTPTTAPRMRDSPFSGPAERQTTPKAAEVSKTPLAVQPSSWLASSPEKKDGNPEAKSQPDSVPSNGRMVPGQGAEAQSTVTASPAKQSFFEDEMVVRDQEDIVAVIEERNNDQAEDLEMFNASQETCDSEEYGDENAMPVDLLSFPNVQAVSSGTIDQASVAMTPLRTVHARPWEIHTVSKVPLRPSDDGTPSRKRSRSASGPLGEVPELGRPVMMRNATTAISYSPETRAKNAREMVATPTRSAPAPSEMATPINEHSNLATPTRSVRRGADAQILRGAVIYVDVHTTEGADASGIFVELLGQMGARCVKQWNWNPRAGTGLAPEAHQTAPPATANGKVGITHVVYKDGGKRTLEKIRDSKGLVLCVGVGWVLDCERENRWLDEGDYAIDTSIVPRGGGKRRKSMEPRALANLNGAIILDASSSAREFLEPGTSSARALPAPPSPSPSPSPAVPATPAGAEGGAAWAAAGSPTTPYFLAEGARLVQQTCPPKQTQERLFPVPGRTDDREDERVRHRLLLARRKSLQWAPRVASPLSRAFSNASGR